jgi:DNA-binding response OmpR family regulator
MEVLVEQVDLTELLGEVESTIAPLLAKNDNTLEVKAINDLGVITSDQTKIRQSLFNLLSNACKFTENGRISLTAERLAAAGGDVIRFVVADDGIGMSEEQSSRLFHAFSQAEVSTSRTYGGTGLGLAITKHFCRMLGGDVSVESEKSKGSTFTITIRAVLAAAEDQAAASKTAAGLDGQTILVIDDEKSARDAIGNALSDVGYVIVTARGGRDGLKLAREYRPDVIILDVIMPDLDGWAVLRALKSDADLADIPVILVTVVGDRDLGLALGAVDYLTKPIAPDELMRVVQRVRRSGEQADVLIVDDDPGTRDVLRRTLSREGWTVREAENGAKGLEELSISKPAIVLLDLMMPEMDGFEMLRAMRANAMWHNVPVVVVTSKDLDRQELEWLRGNTREVFQKGAYGLGELVSSVRGMVESARSDRTHSAMS